METEIIGNEVETLSPELLQKMKLANPVILDVLPLTLEEIFIYELGGMGYDIQNIIL